MGMVDGMLVEFLTPWIGKDVAIAGKVRNISTIRTTVVTIAAKQVKAGSATVEVL